MRMTKQRIQILDIFKSYAKPLSAEMIMEKLPDDALNLSTIYRTLETFYDEELISKSTIEHTNYYYLNDHKHHHYMICLSCHKMIEIDCHLHEFEEQVAKAHQFKVTHHDMTLYGYCHECQPKAS
ncbi:transcriptional repressor [Mycoplasmatota bacterium]|nr:transcriptional repressor [Mycoplasmatota bacterium]